ncbi:thermonuclease family protein [Clostridium sp. BJN0013]|uniref:thermonuclease family protein n=1 Tax=Clostridium sp. BJN0013 TaxID=3236840 RepID=UPI0034C61AEA
MKDILKYVPGFRSGQKLKMVVASIYYVISLLMLTEGFGYFLFLLAAPFVIFYGIGAFKNRSKQSALICILAFIIMIVGVVNTPDTSSKQTNVASNTQSQQTSKKVENTSQSSTDTTAKDEVKSPIQLEKAVVTKHTDGDTIGVTLENGKEAKVRFIGVNTPEPTTEHEQYGEEASNYTKSLLGKTIYIEKDTGDTDTYGRLLRYVWIQPPTEITDDEIRNKMFNAILAYNGYAQQMTVQPNAKYAEYFKKFCADARENSRGLWAININGTTKGDTIAQVDNSSSTGSNIGTSTSSTSQISDSSSAGNSSSSQSSRSTTQESSVQQSASSDNQGTTVYITPTGHKYHNAGCRTIKNSSTAISLSEAKAEGYEPCKVCNPPQ